jgi:capsular polysaccharide biosynthesis protein
MRKAEFEVPSEVMAEFADELASRNLTNTVTGTNEEGEVIVEVQYERDEAKEVDQLEEILEKLRYEIEEEEQEESEEEEDNR